MVVRRDLRRGRRHWAHVRDVVDVFPDAGGGPVARSPRAVVLLRLLPHRAVRGDRGDRGRTACRRLLHRAPLEARLRGYSVGRGSTGRGVHHFRLRPVRMAAADGGPLPSAAPGADLGRVGGGRLAGRRRHLDGQLPVGRHAGPDGHGGRVRIARAPARRGRDREEPVRHLAAELPSWFSCMPSGYATDVAVRGCAPRAQRVKKAARVHVMPASAATNCLFDGGAPRCRKQRQSGAAKNSELPSTLKKSSAKAQRTFAKAHDSAAKQYGEGERAHRVAYDALKHSFEKVGDHWEPKSKKGPSDSRARSGGPHPKGKSAEGVDANASKKHLLEVARKLDISGRSTMSKNELVSAIMKANRRSTARSR